MPITAHTSKSKPEIEFQYGDRPFSETGGIFISQSWIECYLIEIWYADRFPPSYTDTVTKPEPGSTFPTLWLPS